MIEQRRTPYPAAAAGWLIDEPGRRVLDLGSGHGAFAAMLGDAGHQVFALDRSRARISALAGRLGSERHVVAQAEALPYADFSFDVVTASESLHRFAPGLALAEIARVLKPGGVLAVAFNTRDDTVPWVRRLAALLQSADPTAMIGDYGVSSLDQVEDSLYFGRLERKNFRNWVPIDRPGLLAMVERRPTTAALDPDVRKKLLADVADLYATCARPPEPLLLPFQASCWRTRVDHRELKLSDSTDEALQIPLGF